MNQPGRTYSSGSAYRYGFNGQEKDKELNENITTAEFWEYDSRIGRRWNIDPVEKNYESPYLTFAGNPIWIKDENGADSIFYNQDATENKSRRVVMPGDHKYFVIHQDGNLTIGGQKYYQGSSYYSFFGDADHSGPVLFSNVEKNKFPDLKKETIERLVNMQYKKNETYWQIWMNSGAEGTFDYKNAPYFNSNHKTGKEPSNSKTAYLIGGILYNKNEMGLILWGGAMAKTHIGYTGLYTDNKAVHLLTEGNNDELNEMNTWRKGWLIMKDAKDINRYNNTYMYGIFGLYYNQKTQGVDPTNPKGIYDDEWKILGHDGAAKWREAEKKIHNYMKNWKPYQN